MSKHDFRSSHIEHREETGNRSLGEKKSNCSEKAKELLHSKINKLKENIYRHSGKIVKGIEISTTLSDAVSAFSINSDIDKVNEQNGNNVDNTSSSLVFIQGKEYASEKILKETLNKFNLSLPDSQYALDSGQTGLEVGLARLGSTIEKIGSEPEAFIEYITEARKIDPQKYEQHRIGTSDMPYTPPSNGQSGGWPAHDGFRQDYTQKKMDETPELSREIADAVSSKTALDNRGSAMEYPTDYENIRGQVEDEVNKVDPDVFTVKPGTILTRYGGSDGKFMTTPGTPVEKLSLPDDGKNRQEHTYVVQKGFDVQGGTAERCFGKPGGGDQLKLADGERVFDKLKDGSLQEVK